MLPKDGHRARLRRSAPRTAARLLGQSGRASAANSAPLLQMESLWWDFDVSAGWLDGWLVRNPSRQPCKVLHAVQDVSLPISRATALGLVGESGSGESTVARTIAGLTPPTSGRVVTEGIDRCADKAGAATLRRVADVNPKTRASILTSSSAASGSASRSPGR